MNQYVIKTSWETAAADALAELWVSNGMSRPSSTWVTDIEEHLPTLDEARGLAAEWPDLRASLKAIGYATIVNSPGLTYQHVLDTVIGKQRDYGHGNILKFGLVGIVVRLSDKIERLKNLRSSGSTAVNESIFDTRLDIVGYSMIAMMLIDGTFMLDLAPTDLTLF